MAITQMFNKGEKFATYTKDQLLSTVWEDLSSDFIWEGRTLSCYRIPGKDGQLSSGYDVPLGAEMSSNLSSQPIYGIWTMDRSPDPVKVYFIGDSGEVSVDVTESITSRPLGKRSIEHKVSSKDKTYHEINVYRQPDDYGGNPRGPNRILFRINPSSTTTVLSVCFCGRYFDVNKSLQSEPYGWIVSEYTDGPLQFDYRYNGKCWDSSPLTKQYGLSVFFTEQGVMTYYPNKDYVNPNA